MSYVARFLSYSESGERRPDHYRGPMIQPDPDLAADHPLGRGHVAAQVAVERREPQPVVGQLGELVGHGPVEPERVLGQGQALERTVRLVQDRRGRRLVDLTALDPDQAVLDVVDPSDAVRATQRVEPVHQLHGVQPLAVDRDRDPALELDHELDRDRSLGGRDGPLVGVRRRRDPRVLEHARLARAAPEVHVDRVRRRLRDRNLDPTLGGVVDLLVAGQAHPDPHRGDDLESRVEGMDRNVEPDLVVALAGAAVGDRIGALDPRDLDQELGDQRPGERGGQRISALVQRIRLEVRPDEVADEPLAGIDDVGPRRAGADRPLFDALAEGAAADIDRQADDLAVVLLAQPGDGDRGVEAAGIGENDLLHGVS